MAKRVKLASLPATKGVYVNPDLTREEAKAAFETRQAKKNNNPAIHPVNNPAASNP